MTNTFVLLVAAAAAAAADTPGPVRLQAEEVRRIAAPEARQGAVADEDHVYAIDNSRIGKYAKASGERVGAWTGSPKVFPHLNSCAAIARELVCASSNYPGVPMVSSVEVFDPVTLRHVRSVSLGAGFGSLTWLARRDGFWWAGYANYDGRGGEPGRDHRFTSLVKYDDRFVKLESWAFPESVLARFKPSSSSGGAWGADGNLYVTGHDAPEVYVLRLPKAGAILEHVATLTVGFGGQAFAFDPSDPRLIWSIDRSRRQLVATRLPVIPPSGDQPD